MSHLLGFADGKTTFFSLPQAAICARSHTLNPACRHTAPKCRPFSTLPMRGVRHQFPNAPDNRPPTDTQWKINEDAMSKAQG